MRFIDTHAGPAATISASDEAKRSPEWRDGIARLLKARPPAAGRRAAAPYLQAVGPHRRGWAGRMSYPGSPAIAQSLLRPQDRIALCEAHPDERDALIVALGRDGRLQIVGADGYVALNAYLPPKERRGLVLIDPPYEATDEASASSARSRTRASQMAERDLHRLAADQERSRRRAFSQRSRRARRAASILRLELDVGPAPTGAHRQEPLARAGLLIVNPPHMLCRGSADAAALARANCWLAAATAASLRLADGAERSRTALLARASRSVYV